jgi:hypothetical protein
MSLIDSDKGDIMSEYPTVLEVPGNRMGNVLGRFRDDVIEVDRSLPADIKNEVLDHEIYEWDASRRLGRSLDPEEEAGMEAGRLMDKYGSGDIYGFLKSLAMHKLSGYMERLKEYLPWANDALESDTGKWIKRYVAESLGYV